MNPLKDTPAPMIRKLMIIFFISFFFQLLFLAFAFFKVRNNGIVAEETPLSSILKNITIIAVLAVIPGSDYIYKKKVQALENIFPREERMIKLQFAMILKLALLEFVNILCIVSYLISGSQTYLILSGILLVFFLISKPNKEKINNEYHNNQL